MRNQFEAQMAWLDEHATVVNLADIVGCSKRASKKPYVALTFDDGYQSLHDIAAPILERYKFPATVYINSGHIGDISRENSDPSLGHYPNECFMTWEEVTKLKSMGWNIGSHGVNHIDLTLQPNSVVTSQLADSLCQISARTGSPCLDFSYTWGHHNRSLQDAVAAAGYKSAVAGTHSRIKRQSNSFALPRLDIRREYELEDFIAVVRGDWDYLRLYQGLRGLQQ
jgi:peptidoglycan/xylan/chitin deacetylase (PgdA/CDA1 family)